MAEVGWAEGVCPVCGRVWRRERPADFAICDCYKYCPVCGKEMQSYTPDLNPRTYRSEDVDDPTGDAIKHEATIRTRFYCPDCDYYSDGVPVEVKLR
jgi:hypothetical protein